MGTLNIAASIGDTTSGVNQSANKTVTTAGEGTDQRVLSVGTSEAEIALAAGIGNCGYAMVKNLDATNFVEFGFATGVYPIKLLAGQFALMPLATATASVFAKANTAACNVLVYFHEA